MRYIIPIILFSFLLVGCSKDEPAPQPIPQYPYAQPQPKPKKPNQPPPIQPQQPNFSPSYIRGYNDGYSGSWLGPASWIVISEYRAGWSAGNRDRKNGLPNKLER